MPRYSNRLYKRRNYRRTRKTLSTKNIYNRKSATAQANQIYALKRSISKINRKMRPEIYTHNLPSVYSKTFSNGVLADSYWSGYYAWPAPGSGDSDRRGDKIYVKNMSLNFTFEYYNNSSTGYHDSESSGTQIRLILFQVKEPVSTNPQPSDILANWGTTGSDYDCLPITGFKTGVTNKYKIMKDVKFTLTTDRNQKIVKITSPWYSQRFVGNNSNHTFLLVIGCGLHWDTNFTERVKASRFTKTVFYDV